MIRSIFRMSAVFMFVIVLCNSAYAWKQSSNQTTLHVPAEVRLDKVKSVPMSITVATPEGDKYNGPVQLAPGFAKFADQKKDESLLTLDVVDGRASAELLLEGVEMPGTTPLVVTAFMGDEVLAEAEIKLVHPEYITLDTPEVCVAADGKSRPVVQATIKDQYGRPLSDVDIAVSLQDSLAKVKRYDTQTDNKGKVAVELEGRTSEGYTFGQFVTQHLASPQFRIVYAASTSKVTTLRAVVEKCSGTVAWDGSSRSAYAAVKGRKLHVRPGSDLAYVNGKPFTLTSAAQVRAGRVAVPNSFIACVLGEDM